MLRADRLKTGIWVSAQIHLCNAKALPLVVIRKGDPDAGAVLLKIVKPDAGATVLTQTRTAEGDLAWMKGTGADPVTDADADAYIARQLKRDPDIWVIEIEDRDGIYSSELKIL